jgi:hypothetical protein
MKSSDDHFDWDQKVFHRWFRQTKIMPVDFINGYGSELPIRQTSARPAASSRPSAAEADSLATTGAFNASQNQASTSRPEKLARASELLADENYPSEKVLNQLAGFLADKL